MKKHQKIRLLLAGGLLCMGIFASLFSGCKKNNPSKEKQSEKISADEVLEFTAVHFSVSGMSMDSCYGYFIDGTDEGFKLRITCAIWDEDEFETLLSDEEISRVRELICECSVEKWNGFDKRDTDVMDGEGFSFTMDLMCGKTLSASGYCRAPENYQTFKREFEKLFLGYKDKYAYDRIPKTLESDDMDVFTMNLVGKGRLKGEELKFEFRKMEEPDRNTVYINISSASGELSGGVPEKKNYCGKIADIDLSAFQEVVRKYDLPALNGYDFHSTGDGEDFSFWFGYSDGEEVHFSGNVPPENYDAFRKEFMDLGLWLLRQYMEQLKEY